MKYPPTEQERLRFAERHLTYELNMVMNCTVFLRRHQDSINPIKAKYARGETLTTQEKWKLLTYDAVLESWAIHNRLLLEFFTPIAWRPKRKADKVPKGLPAPQGQRQHPANAPAEDFVVDHVGWAVFQFNHTPSAYKKLTNERVAHLSYGRLVPQIAWRLEYATDTMRLAAKFLASADKRVVPQRLLDEFGPLIKDFLSLGWTKKLDTLPLLEFPFERGDEDG